MTITVTYPNPESSFDFEIQAAFSTHNEVFLIGHHKEYNQLSVLGIIVNKDLEGLCYTVWQNPSVKYYNKLISSKVGTVSEIFSDISTGIWSPVDATKIELDIALKAVQRCKSFRSIEKTVIGFLS